MTARDPICTSAAPAPTARLDPVKVFTARCEARALLYYASELTLHAAVDELQVSAVKSGLVGAIGQDAVQTIMARAFAVIRKLEAPC
jgi:hypothetical protein